VTYRDVNGSLAPATHIGGFSVRSADGAETPLFFEAKVDPKQTNAVMLMLNGAIPEGTQLWYGYGVDPYCNLVDSADMAAPVFGPIALPASPTAK
jgi:sialate O-acetylesterase